MEESFLQIEARISNNYPVQRNLWKMWHEVLGLPNMLMIDNNKYIRGPKTFDFTYDASGHCARRLGKAAHFLWHIICHASDEGCLRSTSDIDKVKGLACCKTSAPSWHASYSAFLTLLPMLVQVIPFCKEEWKSQVAQDLLPMDETLWAVDWGTYPQLKAIRKLHTEAYQKTVNTLSQTELVKVSNAVPAADLGECMHHLAALTSSQAFTCRLVSPMRTSWRPSGAACWRTPAAGGQHM